MLGIRFPFSHAGAPTVLCLGAHADDIEIGCGGTILRLLKAFPNSRLTWVVLSANGLREGEARRGATLFGGSNIYDGPLLQAFQDGYLPFHGAEAKTIFEKIKWSVSPDIIFTHYRRDAHQDHRLVSELTWNTFRDHLILEYEIPKYDGDLGRPTVFLPLERELCQAKVQFIFDAFQSQQNRRWFHRETFFSLMRLRGMECNAPSSYAEAFYCSKLVLSADES